MHYIEPYYNWRHFYVSELDKFSPFYQREYSEFEFSNTVFNYFIHPQWDFFGSKTLYLKVLMADYSEHYVILELIGEWNDAIENDIMLLKNYVTDKFEEQGIFKFILIAENVFNFHSGDKDYYAEWQEELIEQNGWIVCINMPECTQHDFIITQLNNYIRLKKIDNWRTYEPYHLFRLVEQKYLN